MATSLEQQRASIQKQAETVRPALTRTATADCNPVPQADLTKMIDEAAQKEGISQDLVREVARQESGFKPCVVSPKGAEGLMQLMPATRAQLQVADPFDPKQSIEAGSKLLKTLLDKYNGNLTLALSAYNAGPRTVDRAGGVPDIPETKAYVISILTRFLQ